MREDLRRDLEQSDLEHRPYRFWDDMWNEKEHSYEEGSEPD